MDVMTAPGQFSLAKGNYSILGKRKGKKLAHTHTTAPGQFIKSDDHRPDGRDPSFIPPRPLLAIRMPSVVVYFGLYTEQRTW